VTDQAFPEYKRQVTVLIPAAVMRLARVEMIVRVSITSELSSLWPASRSSAIGQAHTKWSLQNGRHPQLSALFAKPREFCHLEKHKPALCPFATLLNKTGSISDNSKLTAWENTFQCQ
jgi:hypothetical protein